MQPVIEESGVRGVTTKRSFFRADDGAVSLDWMTLAAGLVVLTSAVIGFYGGQAIGLVDKLTDEDAAHQRAVMAMQSERDARAEHEPRGLYYPDRPEAVEVSVPGGVSGVTVVRPRDAGGAGAFEPHIAEPERHDVSGAAPAMPSVDTYGAGASGVAVGTTQNDAVCADTPWVAESLRQSADCE
ncbi:MAG: hypothetical protein AAFS07_02195 [Pseudomonadota bacterium]